MAFSLALHTGMRRGEILALKGDNVNFKKQTVKIKESLAYTKEHGLIFTTPKTSNSFHEVVIPASLIELLKEMKAEQDVMKQRWVEPITTSTLLFVPQMASRYILVI